DDPVCRMSVEAEKQLLDLPHLDLLTTSQGRLTAEAGELILLQRLGRWQERVRTISFIDEGYAAGPTGQALCEKGPFAPVSAGTLSFEPETQSATAVDSSSAIAGSRKLLPRKRFRNMKSRPGGFVRNNGRGPIS
ncbi:MAG: hypothetical protein N2C14_09025, partial [Planctomycetales bacterium]